VQCTMYRASCRSQSWTTGSINWRLTRPSTRLLKCSSATRSTRFAMFIYYILICSRFSFTPCGLTLGGSCPAGGLVALWSQSNRGGWLSFLLFFHPSTPCGPTVGIERRDSSLLHPVDGCEGGRTQVCYTL